MGSDAGSSVPYNGGSLIGVSIAIGFLQILLVAARFYTRYLRRLSCGLDDYLIIPALIGSLPQPALYIVRMYHLYASPKKAETGSLVKWTRLQDSATIWNMSSRHLGNWSRWKGFPSYLS
ncbi:hypothetical protein AWENTII_006059 [Aspergillus wentii]